MFIYMFIFVYKHLFLLLNIKFAYKRLLHV